MFSWAQETNKMIPLLEENIMMISMQMDAVEKLSVLTKDVALCEAKEMSKLMPDKTKQKSMQMDAAKQNVTELVDMVKETQELSIQRFEAAMRCP